ncbi:MAG: DUF4838 domain-containing protein [Clostridia bacterium]|nr:DUF4838 domain-containing protein [Clostridia bacterium]
MKKIAICGKDISKFTVVYDPAEGENVVFAVSEFVRYIEAASGVRLNAVTPREVTPMMLSKIKIGQAVNSGSYDITGEEDFIIRYYPDMVRILGGQPRGTLYGVYDFLEREIGWRFLTPDCETLTGGDVDLSPMKRSWKPAFEWRDVCSAVYWPADIAAKRKLNSSYSRSLDAKRGGSFFYPGRFIHTMESLLGVPQHHQPCFSDPENVKKCVASVRELLRANPDARVISVSQNDGEMDEDTHCTCPRCAAIDAEEGSHAGSLLRFVNAVAEEIEPEFPKVRIMTLAYLHTLECPKITRPRRNVIMEFAPISMNFCRPVTDPCNSGFISEFEKWTAITDKIYLWDYIVDFSFTVPVFPNFGTLRQNVAYYASHNVTGMFMEGDNYAEDGRCTDLCELRGYLISQLLCDPFMSEETLARHRSEFLEGYYGPGGKHIGRFVDIVTELINMPDRKLHVFQNPQTLFDIPSFISRMPEMEECWNAAESAADSEPQLAHVRRSRLCYTYLKLLYAFDALAENPDTRAAVLEENERFYKALKAIEMRPRGLGVENALPEITDFTKNAAVGIYW